MNIYPFCAYCPFRAYQLVVLIVKSTNLPVPTLILLTRFFSESRLGKSVESVKKARKGICQIPDADLDRIASLVILHV